MRPRIKVNLLKQTFLDLMYKPKLGGLMSRVVIQFIGVLSLAATLSGCAASHQYIKPEDSEHTYNKTYDQVFEAAPEVVKKAGMVFIESRKEEGVIDVVAPPSFWTSSLANLFEGGDKVTVVIKKVTETSTSIHITSQSRGDLVDLGRSARVVGTLFKHFDRTLNS